MADYIERETVLKDIFSVYEREFPTASGAFDEFATKIVPNVISHAPAADVAPVRRGHWVRVGNGTTCSECMQGLLRINGKQSEWVDLSGMPYCPNCGAKMEVEYDEKGRD